jgi:hypothetical protein
VFVCHRLWTVPSRRSRELQFAWPFRSWVHPAMAIMPSVAHFPCLVVSEVLWSLAPIFVPRTRSPWTWCHYRHGSYLHILSLLWPTLVG